MTPALWEAAAAVIVAIALFLGGVYVGRMAPELHDAKATIKRNAVNAEQESTDAQRINAEAKQVAAAALDPVAAPVVRLYYHQAPAPLPRAAAAGPVAASSPVSRTDPLAALPGPDIGRPLVQIGHDADAQVAALLDYIDHVCRVKAP